LTLSFQMVLKPYFTSESRSFDKLDKLAE